MFYKILGYKSLHLSISPIHITCIFSHKSPYIEWMQYLNVKYKYQSCHLVGWQNIFQIKFVEKVEFLAFLTYNGNFESLTFLAYMKIWLINIYFRLRKKKKNGFGLLNKFAPLLVHLFLSVVVR